MNQKEEIEKHVKNLNELRLKLDKAEKIFRSKHGWVKKKLKVLEARYRKLWLERDELLIKVAKVLSDSPERFKEGHTHLLKKEILERYESIGDDQWEYTRTAQSIIWDIYNQFQTQSPEIRKIEKKLESIRLREIGLREKTDAYQAMEEKIRMLERDIKWEEQFIERLKNIGYFRQYSKEQKEQNIKETRKTEVDKEMAKFRAWFCTTYLPKMKEAITQKGENQ